MRSRPMSSGYAALRNRRVCRTMAGFLRSYQPQTYALLRIVTGFLFLWHSAQKLFSGPMPPPPVPSFVVYIGGSIEPIGGFLMRIGLLAGWAAFICSA